MGREGERREICSQKEKNETVGKEEKEKTHFKTIAEQRRETSQKRVVDMKIDVKEISEKRRLSRGSQENEEAQK